MDEQVINQASPDVTAEIKRKAQQMYFSGYKIAEIARQLDIAASTISSWKDREKWDDVAPVGRVELALETRLNLLIAKKKKAEQTIKKLICSAAKWNAWRE